MKLSRFLLTLTVGFAALISGIFSACAGAGFGRFLHSRKKKRKLGIEIRKYFHKKNCARLILPMKATNHMVV